MQRNLQHNLTVLEICWVNSIKNLVLEVLNIERVFAVIAYDPGHNVMP